MLVSFTQTYGDERSLLHQIHFKDKKMMEFKQMFDLNIYAFHNCSKSTIAKFKQDNPLKNVMYLTFNNYHYGETIKFLKENLNRLKCTHFFFSQDDTFSTNNKIDYEELIKYVKNNQFRFLLNLRFNHDIFRFDILPDENLKTFSVYHKNSIEFKRAGLWAMDDSPYICSIDMIDRIYDEDYCNISNVWDAEHYLNNKFSFENLNRSFLNYTTFRNYNILGKNLAHKDENYNELQQRKMAP